jgi:hypothetical protein
MSEFEPITNGLGNSRQLQIIGNYIYGSNYTDVSSNTVSLYRYDITSSSLSSAIVTNIPSNLAIAVNGNDIYTGVNTNSTYADGTIVKSDISNNTFIAYTSTSHPWNGLTYDSYMNKLIAIDFSIYNTYYIITLLDGSSNTYTTENKTITTNTFNLINIVSSPNIITDRYIYILSINGYIYIEYI